MSWLRAHWKTLLAIAGAVLVVVLLFLYTRRRSSAGVVSFPGGSPGGAAPPPAPSSTSGPAALVPDKTGLVTWNAVTYRWFTTRQGESVTDLAHRLASDMNMGRWQDILGRLQFLNPNAHSDSSGTVLWFLPLDTPTPPDAAAWQRLIYNGPLPPEAFQNGQGGPGPAVNSLQRAVMAYQARFHRAALHDPRAARRWRHDALQAAREIRRVHVESRGAAPVRGGAR